METAANFVMINIHMVVPGHWSYPIQGRIALRIVLRAIHAAKPRDAAVSRKKIKRRFTESQRRKGVFARCKTCLSQEKTTRFAQYNAYHDAKGDALYRAVMYLDVVQVEELLSKGADPNYERQQTEYDLQTFSMLPLWTSDGRPFAEPEFDSVEKCYRPTRPLTLVTSLIDMEDFDFYDQLRLYQIAIRLIEAGANLVPAIKFMKPDHDIFEPFERCPVPSRPIRDLNRNINPTSRIIEQVHNGILWLHEKLQCGEFNLEAYLDGSLATCLREASIVQLPERVIQASDMLCPFYQDSVYKKAHKWLMSQHAISILPIELEARILVSVIAMDNRVLLQQIPDPPIKAHADRKQQQHIFMWIGKRNGHVLQFFC